MATGFDDLLDFLLSEIALCGTQGAGSEDFHRFVDKYFERSRERDSPAITDQNGTFQGRAFRDKVWGWLRNHPDIQIRYRAEIRKFSLSEFEALEQQETTTQGAGFSVHRPSSAPEHPPNKLAEMSFGPSSALRNLRGSIRQQLLAEGCDVDHAITLQSNGAFRPRLPHAVQQPVHPISTPKEGDNELPSQHTQSPVPFMSSVSTDTLRQEARSDAPDVEHIEPQQHRKLRGPRKTPKGVRVTEPIFDEPASRSTAPRVYASQDRVWKAVTGHSMDLKKVPAMEFVLLVLIATQGASGIAQPELVKMSQQDKRSVPHRTDELARKGYIEKKPIQEGRLRTSICVHKKFVNDSHFLKQPTRAEDVFQGKTFVLSGFIHLLHKLLKEVDFVPMRDLRKRMGVSVQNWYARSVRGAIIRLEQTGFVKRVLVKKKGSREQWLVCVKLLREPNDEDIKNLRFRRHVVQEQPNEEPLEEDSDGDALMRDIELDMISEAESETADGLDEIDRIPPQWTPDQMLTNLILDTVEAFGPDGGDATRIRERTVGNFWRRPLEAFVSRLTDNWERSQPSHLRHLAIVRDTIITKEKNFVHFVYRTHPNFQKAVDAGEVKWEAVMNKEATKKSSGKKQQSPTPSVRNGSSLDIWGFAPLKVSDFYGGSGSSTLSTCRSAIVRARRRGPHWDTELMQELGFRSPENRRVMGRSVQLSTSLPRMGVMTPAEYKAAELKRQQESATPSVEAAQESPEMPTPSPAVYAGDESSTSLPDHASAGLPKSKPKQIPIPLLCKEQRITLGLPPRGRLGIEIEKQIRAHRKKTGDPISLPDVIIRDTNARPPSLAHRGPNFLTKEIRAAKGLPDTGRLSKTVRDQLRQEFALPEPPRRRGKKPEPREPPLLTMEQRVARGLPRVGRLKQSLIEQLRRERELGIPLAPVSGSSKSESRPTTQGDDEDVNGNHRQEPSIGSGQNHGAPVPVSPPLVAPGLQTRNAEPSSRHSTPVTIGKRKSSTFEKDISQQTPKRMRSASGVSQREHRELEQSKLTPSSSALPLKRGPEHLVDGIAPAPKRIRTYPDGLQPARGVEESGTVDGSLTIPLALPSEGAIITSIEEQLPAAAETLNAGSPTRGPSLSENPSPPHGASEDRSMQIKAKYDNQKKPEVYVNPHATRNIGRGRPRKAFLITIKMARLHDFDWFVHGPGFRQPLTPLSKMPDGFVRRTSLASGDVETEMPLSYRPSDEIEPRTSEPPINTTLEVEVPQPRVSPPAKAPSVAADVHERQFLGRREGSAIAEGSGVSAGSALLTTPDIHPPVSEGWTAINAPAVSRQTAYQSPYAPSKIAHTSPQTPEQSEVDSIVADSAPDLTMPAGTPEEERHSSAAPGMQLLRHQPQPTKLKNPTNRGVVLGRGSVWRIRTAIIREILAICNGAFPFNGEIIAPFETLWEQRAPKKMAKPERSTVLATVKNMIGDPEQNLKKMSFHFQGVDASYMAQKFVIAYKHLTLTSPEVVKIRDGMIQSYPHKYYPPEIRDFVQEQRPPPKPRPPIDETVVIDAHYLPTAKKLDQRIRESQNHRRKEAVDKKLKETEGRKLHDTEVETPGPNAYSNPRSGTRAKRMRLDGLGDMVHPNREDSPEKNTLHGLYEREDVVGEDSIADSDSSEDIPLAKIRPRAAEPSAGDGSFDDDTLSSESNLSSDEEMAESPASTSVPAGNDSKALSTTAPFLQFHPGTGTFSTEFHSAPVRGNDQPASPAEIVPDEVEMPKGTKRVSFLQPTTGNSCKKSRARKRQVAEPDDLYMDPGSEDSDESSDEEVHSRPKTKKSKSANPPPPSLVERLTGLTGNPNDPIYQPSMTPKKRVNKKDRHRRSWAERKMRKAKKESEALDPVDRFKKLCCTLVVASSMSGKDGNVDWTIVEKVYSKDRAFNMPKTKKTWLWMQKNMSDQLRTLSEMFESSYLEAYENGQVASIENPETHDWAGLVQWALRHCKYPEPPLPMRPEDLQEYEIDVSNYDPLDRRSWYKENIAHISRARRVLRSAFALPLHQSSQPLAPAEDNVLRARSWIRSNTATPQFLYDGKLAHDKLRILGEPVLAGVVSDFVQDSFLRMRKIKRLLPGRNYDFTATSAKHYRRSFELKDFMAAVKLKKDVDAAFASQDPDQRTFTVSRTADEGAVMAILSLVSDGRIRIVPKLPPVNNNFGDPLPRLSVWGFCEGGYVHRKLDRERFFWQIDAVPTSTYEFGNPLQPLPFPLAPAETGEPAEWPQLPEPPLPGRNNPAALLPIWSSIDGQTVTWPWWNRILNMVLQSLMFQPGASATEIYQHCPKHTTEVFEIELVLSWLESVNAAKQTTHGTFIVQPGFWAVFGDKIIDEESDWFGERVKRQRTNVSKQPWRADYNLGFSTLQDGQAAQAQQQDGEGKEGGANGRMQEGTNVPIQEQILHNSRAQYRLTREALDSQQGQDQDAQLDTSATGPKESQEPLSQGHTPDSITAISEQDHEVTIPESQASPVVASEPQTGRNEDVVMADADIDAVGEDVDAEGELDDEFL